MTVLRAVMDIDPKDPQMKEIGLVAYEYGLFDMIEVMTFLVESIKPENKSLIQIIDNDNYEFAIKVYLARAILAYANWKHEKFEVELPTKSNERQLVSFSRAYPTEQNRAIGDKYLEKARYLITRFGPRKEA